MYIKNSVSVNDGLNDAEQVITIVKNVDGSGSFTTGMGVTLANTGTSVDGISSVKATVALVKGFMGIAMQNIPINGYGQVLTWGYAPTVFYSNVGTSVTITAGDTLTFGAVAGTFFSSITPQGMSTLLYRYAFATSTVLGLSAIGDVSTGTGAIVRAL